MKFVLIACLGSLALAQQEPALQGPGPFIRDLTADTLRDFPDLCFSSTNFRLHLENQSWSLFPFCGRADCVKKGDNFVERVHDCGPQPKNAENCTISNLAELQRNDTILEYPACCPKYTCPEGVTLQYPTQKEIQAEIEKQNQAALQAAKEAATAREAAQPETLAGPQQPDQGPGPFVRELPSDMLRDFPDLCFSSTNFRLYLENQSWSLFPFCGRADCIKKGGNFFERVHDCGPQPKNGADCTISNLAELQRNDTILEYPACCPKYTCPEGVTLQYPTEKEIQAEIEKQTQTALQAAKEAAAARESAGSA